MREKHTECMFLTPRVSNLQEEVPLGQACFVELKLTLKLPLAQAAGLPRP